jgi:rubrerythrin
VEQQQQKAINWMIPAGESTLEVTIGYEQVAVDLTAWLARNEADPYVKQIFDFGLLEDFDHLYRYANFMEMTEGTKAEDIVGSYTEVMPGRPTMVEHRHPFDDIRTFADRTKGKPQTQLNILTLLAGEQQTMNFYMNMGNRIKDDVGRGLYLEIAQIEEQHVTQYESLLDPRASWFEMQVLHEYNECWLYHSFMEQEPDPQAKKMWELHLMMELEHLRIACEMLQHYENKDAASFLPKELPAPVTFESNVEYVRQILESQVDYTASGTDIIPFDKLPKDHRYFFYEEKVNDNVPVPSQSVIEQRIAKKGEDYRLELSGPHPVERFQKRQSALTHEIQEVLHGNA